MDEIIEIIEENRSAFTDADCIVPIWSTGDLAPAVEKSAGRALDVLHG